MHAITLSYSLSYAAAVKLGIARSGTDTVAADGVLSYLSDGEREWLAAHPKAVFALDTVVEGADDLVGTRLDRALAREIRSACAADDPARLRAAITADVVRKLDDARGGDAVATYASVQRRVNDGTSHRSGSFGDLVDEDVGPVMLAALDRYIERCLAALRLPVVIDVDKAPALLRGAFADGRARVLDAVVADVERQAGDSPLTLHVNPLWARRRYTEGSLGVQRSTVGDGWIVADGGSAVHDVRLAGVIEASIAAAEARLAATRAAEEAEAREALAQLEACLDPEQVARHRLGALPDSELTQALLDDLVRRIERAVGPDYSVGPLDEVVVRWGELPRGGSDVARSLDQLACVEEWGDASDLASGPLVAVRAVAVDGTEYLLAVEPSA